MTTRRVLVGALVTAVYVVTAALTIQLSAHHVRPLYEGFAPPAAYQWVNPPPEFAATNVKPRPSDGALALVEGGSAPGAVNTPDGQLSLNLPTAAFPPHPPDVEVQFHMTPLDPAKLGAPPSGLAANGNAYRIEMAFGPSKTATGPLQKPGNIFLVAPEPATVLLFSTDGKRWQQLESLGTHVTTSIAAELDQPGYFLAAKPPTDEASGGSSVLVRVVLIGVGTACFALALLLGPGLIRRLRGGPATADKKAPAKGAARASTASTTRTTSTTRAASKKTSKKKRR